MDIFDGGKRKADVLQASATLKQRKEELANLQGQIDQEVRAALLDLNSAADQVAVAQSNVELANQTDAGTRRLPPALPTTLKWCRRRIRYPPRSRILSPAFIPITSPKWRWQGRWARRKRI
jgi:hypothetical protein